MLERSEYALILLDINLPDGSGLDLCKLIKPNHPNTLVIFLTANDQESEQIMGYEAGAVDYITNPFSIAALQKKINAMFAMLENHRLEKDVYDDGSLYLDFSGMTAALNGREISLSTLEYKMLDLFCRNPKHVLTRGQLLDKLWDAEEKYVDEHTLTTTISRIRAKIEVDGDTYIKTIYGMGYQWIVLADEPTGNLDSRTSADVLGLLKRTSGEFNQTIVMLTHNNEIALYLQSSP